MTKLQDFNRAICGGRNPGRLYAMKDGRETVGYEMWLLDAECDPVKVTYDCDGVAQIHTDELSYIVLHPYQLQAIVHAGYEVKHRMRSK